MKIFKSLLIKHIVGVNKLENEIYGIIKHTGPISVFNFMREVLTNSSNGYYMKRDVFGLHGDFITSPEISQMFGELCGIWLMNEWRVIGGPRPVQIVELGPGRGSLMSDIITTLARLPGDMLASASVAMVEVSPALQAIQRGAMARCNTRIGRDVHAEWYNDLKEVPRGVVSVFLAHEFLDVLPVHKFKRDREGRWREVLIDVLKAPCGDHELGFIVADQDTAATVAFKEILDRQGGAADAEVSPQSVAVVEEMGARIVAAGGVALIADYGHCGVKGDTLRAFRDHRVCHPLRHLGDTDLTADVDFRLLVDSLAHTFPSQLSVHGPLCQHDFLKQMGIDTRLAVLLDGCRSKAEVDHLISGYRIMMSASEMGRRFKFLSFIANSTDLYPHVYVPAGFSPL